MSPIPRRRFLHLIGRVGAPLGLAAAGFLARPARVAHAHSAALHRVQRTSKALGTSVSLVALHSDPGAGRRAIDAAFDELELVESLLSIYRPESQLSRLNRDKVLSQPHPHLVEVLRAAREMSMRTQGAFDVTVQPLWELYAAAKQAERGPTVEEVEQARRRVGWRRLEISSSQVCLRGERTAVTLNGIAQGFAADRVALTLRQHGIQHALIDTGEIGTLGRKEEDSAWSVGIQHPRQADAYVAVSDLADRCLATSGDYATSFDADFRRHHLLDPRTGESPEDLCSVSVTARSAMQADALSTAAFVLGADAGLRLIRETLGADALLIRKDGRAVATSNFPCRRQG